MLYMLTVACLLQVKWGDVDYGPIFNDTFLSAVFKLQDQIQKVDRVPSNIRYVALRTKLRAD